MISPILRTVNELHGFGYNTLDLLRDVADESFVVRVTDAVLEFVLDAVNVQQRCAAIVICAGDSN